VLDWFGVRHGRRVLAEAGRDHRFQPPPGLPFVGGVVTHLERGELSVAQGQVHPARLDALQAGQQV